MKTRTLPTFFALAFAAIITANAQTETQEKITYHDPGLKKVVQVAIVVRDIETTARLWAELLDVPLPRISTSRPGKEVKEFYIPKQLRESSLYGTEFEIRLRNQLTQRVIARECAEWIKNKVKFKSNITARGLQNFIHVDNKNTDLEV